MHQGRFLLATGLSLLWASVAALGIVLAGATAGETMLQWCMVFVIGLPLFGLIVHWFPSSGSSVSSPRAMRRRLGSTDWDAELAQLLEEMGL